MSVKNIDFSCKKDIMIRNADGTLSPMNQPWFANEQIAPGTWKIQSSGDYCYLLAGDEEAIAIDCGYGAGNIREYMESLCGLPVHSVANTHDHFDHTACNAYFEKSFSSAKTAEYATIPFPSFSGIDFHPRDYERVILQDGDTIPLKGRELLVLSIPDHAPGSMMYVDRKQRILFAGDEIFSMEMGKSLNWGLASWVKNLEKIVSHEKEFDRCFGGAGFFPKEHLMAFLDCARYAMTAEGQPLPPQKPWKREDEYDAEGHIVYDRRMPHPGDRSKYKPEDTPKHALENMRLVQHGGTFLTYDCTMMNS